jgi:diguanylate cyclase (GGDEF)-like protein
LKGCILLVEDSPTQADWLAEVLASEGHEVVIARDGGQALGHLRGQAIDLVLLDLVLPDMDGLDVLRAVKDAPERGFVPVIVLSARSDVRSRVNGLRTGADDYLPKPFDEEEALARVAGMLRIKHLQDELSAAKAELLALSVTDGLTGLPNRRFFDARLRDELSRSERYSDPVSMLIVDLDHFKALNDRFGHPFGDRVLRQAAQHMKSSLRDPDVCARWGGDEFAVILPKTDLGRARRVGERILQAIRAQTFEPSTSEGSARDREVRLTVSIGIAQFPSDGAATPDALVAQADEALYRAKRAGRDTLSVHGEPT